MRGTPRPHRPGRERPGGGVVPFVGVMLSALLGIGLTGVSTIPGSTLPGGNASQYIPDPGASAISGDSVQSNWSMPEGEKVLMGPPAVVASASAFGESLAQMAEETWVREIQTTQDGEQLSTFFTLDDAGLHRRATGSLQSMMAFDPPLLELPADVEDGSQWSSSGSVLDPAGDTREYSAQSLAEQVQSGCLAVTTRVTIDSQESAGTRTWCQDGRAAVVGEPSDATPQPFEPGPETSWTPESWAIETHRIAHLNKPLPVVGFAFGGADNEVYLHGETTDLVGLDTSGSMWSSAWWFAPPGITTDILQMGSHTWLATRRGTVVLAPNHQVQFQVPAEEVVTDLVELDPYHVLTVDTSGALMSVRASDGQVSWASQQPGVWQGDLTTCPLGIAVSDGTAMARVISPADGHVAHEVKFGDDIEQVTCTDGVLVGKELGTSISGVSTSGVELWSSDVPIDVREADLLTVGDTVAVVGKLDGQGTAVVVLDARTGEARSTETGLLAAATDGSHLALLDHAGLRVVGPDGTTLAEYPLPIPENIDGARCETRPNGLQCLVGGSNVVVVR